MIVLKQTETFRNWHRKLKDETAKALISARLLRLANGLAGDTVSVGGGVNELRIHFGPGYRVYYKLRRNETAVLLCGGNKSTQERDITAARALAAIWEDRDG